MIWKKHNYMSNTQRLTIRIWSEVYLRQMGRHGLHKLHGLFAVGK